MSIQGWRLHIVSGHPVALLSHSVSEKGFPDPQMEPPVFQIVPAASGPVTGKSLTLCFSPSVRCLYTLVRSSLLFPRMNNPARFSHPLLLYLSVNVQLVNLTYCFFSLCPVPFEMYLDDYNMGLYYINFFPS